MPGRAAASDVPDPLKALQDMANLRQVLGSIRVRLQREEDLQEGIARRLEELRIPFTREARLGPMDRVDFLVGHVALEVKVEGSLNRVASQLVRYARHDEVHAVLLVSTRLQLGFKDATVQGKPVASLVLLRGLQ